MVALVVASGSVLVSIVSLLVIFFVITGENILVCCICPNGGICASVTMVAAPEVREGEALEKTEASGVYLLFRDTCQFLSLSRVSSFILLVFYFIVPVFCFR